MQTFTMSDLIHATGKVVSAADRDAVKLTSRGREKYVILRVEEFDRMQLALKAGDPRRVFASQDMPDDLAEALFSGVPDADAANLGLVHGTRPYDPAVSEADGLRLVAEPETP